MLEDETTAGKSINNRAFENHNHLKDWIFWCIHKNRLTTKSLATCNIICECDIHVSNFINENEVLIPYIINLFEIFIKSSTCHRLVNGLSLMELKRLVGLLTGQWPSRSNSNRAAGFIFLGWLIRERWLFIIHKEHQTIKTHVLY